MTEQSDIAFKSGAIIAMPLNKSIEGSILHAKRSQDFSPDVLRVAGRRTA